MAEDLGERTEQPTGKRLGEARSRGQIAKSQDLSAAIDLTAGAILVAVLGGGTLAVLASILRGVLSGQTPGDALDPGSLPPTIAVVAWRAGTAALPFLIVMMLVGMAGQFLQVGWLFTTRPLKPRLDRLDPVRGVRNLVRLRNLVKLVLNTGKLGVVAGTAGVVIGSNIVEIVSLPALTMAGALARIASLGGQLAAALLAVLLVLAIADFAYQKWQHLRDLKMTKQEVQDERRAMDGDPHVKKRRLRMAMDIAMQRIGQAVPRADVVVTNPTHFAVALRYDDSTMRAPRVVAKGADLLAMRIRLVAGGAGVPIVERPPLARALYWGVPVGREISPEHYEAVAEVLAFVYRLRDRAA